MGRINRADYGMERTDCDGRRLTIRRVISDWLDVGRDSLFDWMTATQHLLLHKTV
jgi:hypothetical protein